MGHQALLTALLGRGIKLSGSKVEAVTFHDAAVVAADGTVFTVGGYKTLLVEVYGTSTAFNVAFYGKGPSGTARAIMGVKLSDLSTGINTTVLNELWVFDVTGLTSVLMDLVSVVSGNVSVKGTAVA